MINFVQKGEVITLTAPYAVSSGDGMLVGSLFGLATTDGASGAEVETFVGSGVFDITKVSAQAWTAGASIYWDDSAKKATTTSSGNTFIGFATLAAANPSSMGRVLTSVGIPGAAGAAGATGPTGPAGA
jgi:predicted RecA/RadA family phage recombinase